MIAPPHYRCETITLKKVEGLALLNEALQIIEKVIKEKNGSFKLVNAPQIIGDSSKDKDLEDIMKMPGERESGDEDSQEEEDNEEGMGDIDLGVEEEEGADHDGEEEEKVDKRKKKSKKPKKESDDSEDDG